MESVITGIGTAQPRHRFAQGDAAEMAAAVTGASGRSLRRLQTIYRQARVAYRGSVLLNEQADDGDGDARGLRDFYGAGDGNGWRGPGVGDRLALYEQHALPLACRAAERAIADAQARDANFERGRITQIVVASCTGMGSPGLEVRLIEALGLSPQTGRTMIGFMGCHGAINAMRVARGLALAESGDVLVVAVELCSLHFQYGDTADKVVANALFADGAGAMVISSAEAESTGSRVLRGTGSHVIGGTQDRMSWRVGAHGFEMTLAGDVPELIRGGVGQWLDEWLVGYGLSREEVGGWVIHPGGPRVVQAVVAGLGLAEEAGRVSRQVLRECGNMSSPTVVFIAERLMREGVDGPVAWLAFGPGLVCEAALVE